MGSPSRPRRRRLDAVVTLLLLGFTLGALPTRAASGGASDVPAGQQWAVLIAVQSYTDPRNSLRFTLADAELMRSILTDRAGVPADHILELTDRAQDAGLQPRLQNVRRELPKFLARIDKEDRVVVYFSGHGLQEGGRSELVLADTHDASDALPIAELRSDLAACRAAVKFLILDACHSGGAKGLRPIEPENLAWEIVRERLPGAVVLASSRGDQSSWEWNERGHGVFTYWLSRALEGGADTNGDGRLTVDEVYNYTHDRVTATVQQVFRAEQTPMRLLGEVTGVPVLLSLRPEPAESLCRRLAEQIDLEVRRQGLKKLAVLEFLEPTGHAEGLAAANLPAYCADRVRATLKELGAGAYAVADPDAAEGMRVEALGDPAAMRVLGDCAGVVSGTLRRRGRNLNLQCDLVAVASGESLASPAGMLPLSEDVLADNGASFNNAGRPPGEPHAAPVLEHAQEQARQGHPLLDPSFPFRVEVWSIKARLGEPITAATPRHRKDFTAPQAPPGAAPEVATPALQVPARDGEVFEIRVWNNSPEPVAMTLLVDGLNSLGQGRERLGQAQYWVLEPTKDPNKPHILEGWYIQKTPNATPGHRADYTVKRFQFTEVARSVAGRQNFGDSIGLITAAFYARRGRGLGVGEGPEEARRVRMVDFAPGRLLGVVQIRYVDERDLE